MGQLEEARKEKQAVVLDRMRQGRTGQRVSSQPSIREAGWFDAAAALALQRDPQSSSQLRHQWQASEGLLHETQKSLRSSIYSKYGQEEEYSGMGRRESLTPGLGRPAQKRVRIFATAKRRSRSAELLRREQAALDCKLKEQVQTFK